MYPVMIGAMDFVLIGMAAAAAGAVNALAGGGTLIAFPVLTAIGVPAVAANVTCTVALSPGYLGGTLAQAGDLRDQKRRMWLLIPAGIIGGVLGGMLLLQTGERQFRSLVPYLILGASGLLALQEPLRARVLRRLNSASSAAAPARSSASLKFALVPVGLAAIYGGYFGAGVSVIILAVLGLVLDDSLTRLNALKQSIAFATNTAAAIFFVFSGKVQWPAAAVMAVCSVGGGALGGRLAGRVKPTMLRWIVVVIGVAVAVIYLVRR